MIDDLSFLGKEIKKELKKLLTKALPARDFSNITEAIHYSVLMVEKNKASTDISCS